MQFFQMMYLAKLRASLLNVMLFYISIRLFRSMATMAAFMAEFARISRLDNFDDHQNDHTEIEGCF